MREITGIYYADLFEINGKGCVIMGHGKSKTCRNHTGSTTKEIMTDSIRFSKNGRELTAYGDAAMGFIPFNPSKHPSTKVDYMVYMYDEDETKGTSVKKISKRKFRNLADFNVTMGTLDMREREKEFAKLLKGTDVICLAVPWCKTMEQKGALVAAAIV